jgi:hypothetical protein
MKKGTFFHDCNWAHILLGFKPQNNYLLAQIVDQIPLKYQVVLTEDPPTQDDGFAMLRNLIQSLHPDTIKQKLLAISNLAALEFATVDTTASYIAKIRGLATLSAASLLAASCPQPPQPRPLTGYQSFLPQS